MCLVSVGVYLSCCFVCRCCSNLLVVETVMALGKPPMVVCVSVKTLVVVF